MKNEFPNWIGWIDFQIPAVMRSHLKTSALIASQGTTRIPLPTRAS
ncbi:hypothetical protein [Nostoc sp.]